MMKKKLSLLLAAAMSLSLMAGCVKTPPAAEPAPPQEPEVVEPAPDPAGDPEAVESATLRGREHCFIGNKFCYANA